jgi:MFS family permease
MTSHTPDTEPPSTQAAGQPEVAPRTSTIYVDKRPLHRYILWFTVATAAFTTIWGSTAGILLPNHIQMIEFGTWFAGADAGTNLQQLTQLKAAVDAGTVQPSADQQRLLGILGQFEASRAAALGFVVSLSTIATMLIQPLVGVFSDRTRSPLGRRAPWMLYGAIIGSVALVGLRFSPTITLVAVFWMIAQAVLNGALTPMTATVADRVAENKRGTVSSMAGLGNIIGGIVGAILAGALFGVLGLNIYVLWGVLVVFAVAMFVWRNPDQSTRNMKVAPFHWGAFLRGFTVPLRAADFRWVWIARVLLVFGYTVSSALSLYMLQSYVQPGLSAEEATSLAPIFAIAGLPFTVVAVIFAGRLSDKIGRRKPFIIVASLLMAASMVIPLLSPTIPALLIQAILGALAFGIFLPVDQALFIDVLPDQESAGRDLGVAAVATNLGQALGPILAAQVVVLTGGYQMVWASALILVLVAAFAIIPVKGAR